MTAVRYKFYAVQKFEFEAELGVDFTQVDQMSKAPTNS